MTALVSPGVFAKNGETYIVKPNRAGSRVYAMRIVGASGDRLMGNGAVAKIETEYARGVIFDLSDADRMALADVEALSAQYGRCLCCGHGLKAAKSVARLVGPVCAKKFSLA